MLEVKRKPRHPGELIQRQYLEPLGMTIAELAQIVAGTAGVTPEVALRLAAIPNLNSSVGYRNCDDVMQLKNLKAINPN